MSAPLDSIDSKQLLLALLTMAVAERDERVAQGDSATRRSELLLADVGIDAATVAAITGKNVGAVRKAIQRDRKDKSKGKASG